MKKIKSLALLLLLPLLVSCSDELVIPTVNVEKIKVTLPAKPTYNTGDIRSDGTYDFIDLYEISDFHGAVNFESHSSGDYIGLPSLASYFSIKRESNEGGTVLISSGDMFQGSAESNLTRGYMVNYSMNYMGFDSMTLGNHEFDWTDEWIIKNANLAYNGHKIPYLAANLREKSSGNMPDFVQKSTVVERGNYKIGIIGTIGSELRSSILETCVSNYEFLEEKPIVESEAAALREAGCNIVVWSTHNGVDAINFVDGVDAIFGGHAHENKATEIGSIPAVATKNYGRGVAHIELKINKTTKEVSKGTYEVDENPCELEDLLEDPQINKIMKQYDKAINKIKNIKVGSCRETLEIDSELKCICVEAMTQAAKKANTELNLGIDESKILAAYHNVSGGIRADIEKGRIRYKDVYKPFPFDNEIVFYKVHGADYKTMCTKTEVQGWGTWKSFNSKYDINENEDYYLVLTDYMALSDQYVKKYFRDIEESDLIRTGKVVREEVANLIHKEKKIDSSKFSSAKPCYQAPEAY